jgi:hypothetical protein
MTATARALILGLTAILIGLPLTGWTFLLSHNSLADFRAYYVAGYMLRTGQPLYDYALQMQVQNRQVSPEAVATPFLHPAYEALFYVPLSFLGYLQAYWVWVAVNLMVLICVYRLLRPELKTLSSVASWLPPATFAAFLPVGAAIVQGQDTLLVLMLLALAFTWFHNVEHLFIAGMLLGLAVFRFQIVVPIILCMLFWRRWKIVLGFSITALSAATVSLLIAGFWPYVNTVLRLSLQPEFVFLGPVSRMPNLRGLIHSLGGGDWIVLAASLTVLGITVLAGARCDLQWQLALAVTAAALVAYHGFVYDLSLLLIPLARLIHTNSQSALVITGICFLSPALAAFAPDHSYLAVFAVLALFVYLAVVLRQAERYSRFELITPAL